MLRVAPAPGRCRLSMQAGLLSPRVISADASGARVALVATGALLLGGDHVRIDVLVESGGWLEIVEIAGTVAFDAAGVASGWTTSIEVEAGAALTWSTEPLVVSDGANVVRRSMIDVATGGVAVVHDTLVLGRTGQVGGAITAGTVVRVDGRELLVEELHLASDGGRARPGLLGPHRVVDSLSCIGFRAPTEVVHAPGERFELDGPGTVLRRVTDRTDTLASRNWWTACVAAARGRPSGGGTPADRAD